MANHYKKQKPSKVNEKNMLLDAVKDLEAYRNIYLFYFDTARMMMKNLKNSNMASINLMKRAIDRANLLKNCLESEDYIFGPPVYLNDCFTPSYWSAFRFSLECKNYLGIVKGDIEEMEEEINRKMCKMPDIQANEVVMSRLQKESNVTISTTKDSSFVVKRIRTNHKMKKTQEKELVIGMRLMVVYNIENFGDKVDFYYKIKRFDRQIKKKKDKDLFPIIDRFCNEMLS